MYLIWIIKKLHAARYTLYAVLLIAGCATGLPEKPTGEYLWPPPPETPKIKWLTQWSNQYDFGRPGIISSLITGEEAARLSRPSGVVADSAGNIYVADSELGVIFVFDQELNTLRLLGGRILSSPVGLAIDNSTGILYVADSRQDKVIGLDKKSGHIVFSLGGPSEFKNPSGIVVDEARDRLYVTDTQNHTVRVFTRKGNPLFTIGEKGHQNGKFYYPSYLALDREGRLYVCDSFNFRVQIFSPDGLFLKTFGRLGDASGTFTRPKGIGVDSEGHIYVVDAAFNNFQIFDQDGRLLLWMGKEGHEPGQFSLPTGMFIDHEDRIYVSDTFNRRVQVFQYLKQK